MSYNRQLMMAILHDKVQIAKAVNATVDLRWTMRRRATRTSTRERPSKYVIDPHGLIPAA